MEVDKVVAVAFLTPVLAFSIVLFALITSYALVSLALAVLPRAGGGGGDERIGVGLGSRFMPSKSPLRLDSRWSDVAARSLSSLRPNPTSTATGPEGVA